jgi:CheY-like chemotaxis protein
MADTAAEGRVVAAPEGDAAAPDGDEMQARPPRRRRGLHLDHILVVDDSEIALRFMAKHLQRFGFQIHLATSGEEALRRVAERRFEFVFLDVRMEGLDGFQTCKAIKRADYPAGRAAPTVVMLTCLAGAADRLRGTMAGADAYLTKPLREVELLKLVGEREVARHAYADTAPASTRR